jgi:diguanylate cyclase (GGDEF)-like protein
MNYLLRTLKKLQEEVLGKALYDLLKYGVIAIIGLLAGAITLGWMSLIVTLPLWVLLLLLVLTVVATSVVWARISAARLKPLVVSNRTDALTHLLNTHALQEDLEIAIVKARSAKEPLSLILFDIDDFKRFNTQYGSVVADQVLAKLGEVLLSDTRLTDTMYRQHTRGDEFVIITRNTSQMFARVAAERKHKNIAETGMHISSHHEPLYLTICCAIVELNASDTKETLLGRASIAMNKAKEYPGKNRIESIV